MRNKELSGLDRLELLNSEGPLLVILRSEEEPGYFYAIDTKGFLLGYYNRYEVIDFVEGRIKINEWDYPSVSEGMKQSREAIDEFLGEDESPTEEDWDYVKSKMKNEGFHYCFVNYSHFEEIKDPKFHRLREDFIDASNNLEKYINEKANKRY